MCSKSIEHKTTKKEDFISVSLNSEIKNIKLKQKLNKLTKHFEFLTYNNFKCHLLFRVYFIRYRFGLVNGRCK